MNNYPLWICSFETFSHPTVWIKESEGVTCASLLPGKDPPAARLGRVTQTDVKVFAKHSSKSAI
jgi:hypothetical protein